MSAEVEYRTRPPLSSDDLNDLFGRIWDDHTPSDLSSVIERSLTYICAYIDQELIGYVNVAWDGGEHAFLLDTAVDPSHRRKGIGTHLVLHAAKDTEARGLRWLHVDFEPHLESFYHACGFRDTMAGLIRLND